MKRHKWFRGVDWVGLLDKNVRVSVYQQWLFICEPNNLGIQAPIVPHYPHPGDTSNFEKYPEQFDTDNQNAYGEDPFKDLFVDFS